MSKRRKIVVFNESLWEEYVWKYPEKFLDRPLKKFKRQWKLPTAGRPDLVFKCDDGRLLLVEIQLKALDRNHFFKTFEYRLEIQEITKKPVDILILCNSINERKKFLKLARDMHNQHIELVVIPKDRVIKIIQEIAPHLEIQNNKKISLEDKFEASLTDKEKRLTEIYRTELDRLRTEVESKELQVENLKFASLPKFISKHVEQKENYDNEFVWKRELFKQIQQVVEPFETGFLKKERVFCPLCEYSPEGYYMEPIGFSYPTGFERHILGTHNVRHCPVTKRAIELVMPYFDQRSDQQQKDKELEKDQRRLEEDTYLISPNDTPLLIDEGLFSY